MRTREEVVKLMGAKDREVDSVVEVPDGTVVTIHGYRTLIHPDGSMTHGVDEPEVEIVGEISDEDAAKVAALVNGESDDDEDDFTEDDEDAEDAEVATADVDPVPDGSIAVVLEWVGQDQARAERALDAELHRDPQRSTLVAQLSQLLASIGAAS
jgi:hypothetical protein